MSVLGHANLIKRLTAESFSERLVVTPLMIASQVAEASIDIRLGNDFIITRRGNLASIDPARTDVREHRYQTRHYVNLRKPFYLHPNELVLASTLEYFRLPKDLAGSVTSRSSWGRAGLIIATATAVHPGFCGAITLELVNHGEVPLVLYPGISVAQIVLFECEGAKEYDGRFAKHVEPKHASVTGDSQKDLDFWTPRPASD